jgi:hypothetical protein
MFMCHGFANTASTQGGCIQGVWSEMLQLLQQAVVYTHVLHCTNLRSVQGWGLVACEVIEDFDGEDGEDGD